MLHESVYLHVPGEQTVRVAGPEAKQDSGVSARFFLHNYNDSINQIVLFTGSVCFDLIPLLNQIPKAIVTHY